MSDDLNILEKLQKDLNKEDSNFSIVEPVYDKSEAPMIDVSDTASAKLFERRNIKASEISELTGLHMAANPYTNYGIYFGSSWGLYAALAATGVPFLPAIGAAIGGASALMGVQAYHKSDVKRLSESYSRRDFLYDQYKSKHEFEGMTDFQKGLGAASTFGVLPESYVPESGMGLFGNIAGTLMNDIVAQRIGGGNLAVGLGISSAFTEYNKRIGLGKDQEEALKAAAVYGIASGGTAGTFMHLLPGLSKWVGKRVLNPNTFKGFTSTKAKIIGGGAEMVGWASTEKKLKNVGLKTMLGEHNPDEEFTPEEFLVSFGLGAGLSMFSQGVGRIFKANKTKKQIDNDLLKTAEIAVKNEEVIIKDDLIKVKDEVSNTKTYFPENSKGTGIKSNEGGSFFPETQKSKSIVEKRKEISLLKEKAKMRIDNDRELVFSELFGVNKEDTVRQIKAAAIKKNISPGDELRQYIRSNNYIISDKEIESLITNFLH